MTGRSHDVKRVSHLRRNVLRLVVALLLVSTLIWVLVVFGYIRLHPPQPRFDVNEPLPSLSGVHAVLKEAACAESRDHGVPCEEGELIVRLTIENRRDDRVDVLTQPRLEVNQIVVRTPAGTAADEIGRKPWYAELLDTAPRSMISASHIEPGRRQQFYFAVSRLFDMTEPGDYTVDISTRFQLRGGNQHYRTTPATLTVTVLPKTDSP